MAAVAIATEKIKHCPFFLCRYLPGGKNYKSNMDGLEENL
jgi:hypothetical protein